MRHGWRSSLDRGPAITPSAPLAFPASHLDPQLLRPTRLSSNEAPIRVRDVLPQAACSDIPPRHTLSQMQRSQLAGGHNRTADTLSPPVQIAPRPNYCSSA